MVAHSLRALPAVAVCCGPTPGRLSPFPCGRPSRPALLSPPTRPPGVSVPSLLPGSGRLVELTQ